MNALKKLKTCLTEHQDEILVKWERSLSENERFVSFQLTGNVRELLAQIFRDVLSFLKEDEFMFTRPHTIDIPLNAPRHEVAVIVNGEGVVVQVLKQHLSVSDEDWLLLRKKINLAFHEVLSAYVRDVCDMCRSAAHEKLSQTLGLKELLEKSLPFNEKT
jgi:hypothetical protein